MGVCETKAQGCSYGLAIMSWTSSPTPIIAAKHVLLHMGAHSYTAQTQLRAETALELQLAHVHHKHTVCGHRNKITTPQSGRYLHTESHLFECAPWTQRDAFLLLATKTCARPPIPSTCPACLTYPLSWGLTRHSRSSIALHHTALLHLLLVVHHTHVSTPSRPLQSPMVFPLVNTHFLFHIPSRLVHPQFPPAALTHTNLSTHSIKIP